MVQRLLDEAFLRVFGLAFTLAVAVLRLLGFGRGSQGG